MQVRGIWRGFKNLEMLSKDMSPYEYLVMISLGVGLSAACGFRIFIPPFLFSIAARADFADIDLAGGDFAWLESTPAIIVLGLATVVEIAAYYIPWLDNALDTISTPSAIGAGIMMSGASLDGADPLLQWSLAVIAGGGVAGGIQLSTVATRAVSALFTGGIGNPIVSTVEAGASVFCVILAILLPIIALFFVAGLLVLSVMMWRKAVAKRAAKKALKVEEAAV